MFKKINKKGFTLAELLIVVAIIGVLVAISIPIFTAQLRKARLATNQANARAAYAAAVAKELESGTSHTAGYSYSYTVDTSTLGDIGTATAATPKAISEWTVDDALDSSTKAGDKTAKELSICFDKDGGYAGVVVTEWRD